MKVSELINSIRVAVDDTNATTYSDYSVLEITNSIFYNVANFLIKHNSSLMYKEASLTFENNEAQLPTDFVSLIEATDSEGEDVPENTRLLASSYKIIGNKIKSKLGTLNIVYSYTFSDKFTMDSDVPFPGQFIEYLKKYIVMVLTNNNKDASITILPVIESDLIELISNREHAGIERDMQFLV